MIFNVILKNNYSRYLCWVKGWIRGMLLKFTVNIEPTNSKTGILQENGSWVPAPFSTHFGKRFCKR